MARLIFVAPPLTTATPPADFGLLSHTLIQSDGTDQILTDPASADLILIDARENLAWAKTASQRLTGREFGRPVLVIASTAALPLLTPDWGFDDFILDSATPAELDARLRFVLSTHSHDLITAGPIIIDEVGYSATLDGASLNLTYTEFELLKYLLLHPGHVLTREHLLSEVWGYGYYGGTRTVDVHIRRLRAKLAPYDHFISTVRNVGYRFTAR